MKKHELVTAFCVATAALCAISTPVAAQNDGVKLGANYTQDYIRNLKGGLRRGPGAPGMINLQATIDGRAWGGLIDDTFYFDALGTTGSSISNQVGDLQGLDNVEAHNTARMYAAWYQHQFANSGISVRLGLQDYNALFNALDPAAVFVNSSFGIDPTISQTTVSIFPQTTVGAVLRWQGSGGVYAMAGVYDGTPGRSGHPNGTQIVFQNGDGTFSSLEVGATGGDQGSWKLALGGWVHHGNYRDPADRPLHRNQGIYAIGSKRLIGSDGHLPAVDAFFQVGSAASSHNTLDHYVGAGIDMTGPFSSRPKDVVGLGVARAHTARVYRRANRDASHAETVLELTWSASVNRHVYVQPDLQYIIDPGADSTVDNALTLGVRVQLAW